MRISDWSSDVCSSDLAARTVLTATGNLDLARINAIIDEMRDELTRVLAKEGYGAGLISETAFDDLRYQGQSLEITVPLDASPLTEHGLRALERLFEDVCEKTYGKS